MPRRAALEVRRVEEPLAYLPLLLEDDPSEARVRESLRDADVYALREGETLLCLAVLVRIDAKTVELKNLATPAEHRGKGYAKRLLKALCGTYRQKYERMIVGTTEGMIPFYVKQGFDRYVRTERDFFPHSDHAGSRDLFYYEKPLKQA
ncbi:MAG: GNAT family N-acetyltransferase [Oscillospiraceae bacterium]|nr:GNAT family N-acetyltransferase [Oscillospiraceae bacterium]